MELCSYDDPSSPGDSINLLEKLSALLCAKAREESAVTPQLLEVERLLVAKDYEGLCKFEIDYGGFENANQASFVRQILAFFTKFKGLPITVDRKLRAKEKFLQADLRCRETDEMFQALECGLFSLRPQHGAIFHRAMRKISKVLGPVPSLSQLRFRFGRGANRSVKKQNASVVEKLQARLTCSEELYPVVRALLDELPEFRDFHTVPTALGPVAPVVITGGRVAFVPKDSFIDRVIDTPCSLNGLAQTATGDYMTERLRIFGLPLDDQTLNQRLAKEGSLTGVFATIDLVSASDMISKRLISHLLPFEWYVFLSQMITSKTQVDGEIYDQNKFCSMGNGFTFPLETLVFWALSSSVREEGWASVYGDDIVVKQEDFAAVCDILRVAGFEPNSKKSFASGNFRESCGKDYFRGVLIRPAYQKELVSCAELFRLHNFFYRKGDYYMSKEILAEIPNHIRLYGPDGYGDGHLLGRWKPYKKAEHRAKGYGGVLFDTYQLCGRRDERRYRMGDMLLPSYSIYIRKDADRVLQEPDEGDHYKKWLAFFRYSFKMSSEAIPNSSVDARVKACSLPGTVGYKRISIYTFLS